MKKKKANKKLNKKKIKKEEDEEIQNFYNEQELLQMGIPLNFGKPKKK